MTTTVAIAIAIVIVVVAAIVIWWAMRQRERSRELRTRFGPEYDHAVEEYGGEHKAEKALETRTERVQQLNIHDLSPDESAHYASAWEEVQRQFVDDPERALTRADELVLEAMEKRGYPMGEFEQRAADISVDHPQVVEHYRVAHRTAGRAQRGEAPTEELRQAMVHYRALFQELTQSGQATPGREVRR